MLKDLLLVADVGDADASAVDAALRLAERHQAHLAVALVSSVPEIDFALSLRAPFVSLDPYRERADAKEKAVRQAAERRGVQADIRVLSDAPNALLDKCPEQTRYSDLVLFGAPQGWADDWLRRRLLENTLLGSGRPALLLPASGAIPSFARTMIAWNGSAEAARAVGAALPLLKPGAKIVVATVNAGAAEPSPGSDLAGNLVRHGFRVEVAVETCPQPLESDRLVELARGRGVDLLVTGAFARSRLRELILGGVTQELLRNPVLPTLMMH